MLELGACRHPFWRWRVVDGSWQREREGGGWMLGSGHPLGNIGDSAPWGGGGNMTYHMSSATPRSCRHAVLQCIRSNIKQTQEACHHAGRPGSMCYVLCAVSDSWADHNSRGKVKLGEEGQEGKKKKKEGEKFKLTLSQCHSDKVQTGSCVLNTASTDPEGGAEEAAVARSRPIKRPRNGLVGLTGLVVLPHLVEPRRQGR